MMMNTLWLRVSSPFAAFRWFQAGVYRATSPVMPPSTAYGLALNLAAIEMRDSKPGVTTLIRAELPKMRIAVGLISMPERNSLYQQLHSYRVGSDAKTKVLAEKTKGAKYWVSTVRREFLVDYDGVIGIQTEDAELLNRIKLGLRGELEEPRYGLPFLGDNNFLPDRIDADEKPPSGVQWYARMLPDDPPQRGSCRLTVGIDRADNSQTTSSVFAPTTELTEKAWTWVPKSPEIQQ